MKKFGAAFVEMEEDDAFKSPPKKAGVPRSRTSSPRKQVQESKYRFVEKIIHSYRNNEPRRYGAADKEKDAERASN